MRAYDIILKKRNGENLLPAEIEFLVEGFVNGDVPDYQMAAFCMAVFFKNLSQEETSVLTKAMVNSGDRLDLSEIEGVKVDKHSTGGVGDKTTLVVVPLAASLGVPVAKMSGRGLGHTGGTVDKLESIPGFRTDLSLEEFLRTVKQAGAAIVGQTANLVPADKKLYALRDVTATVDSIPLIASSIMSKKIAAGCDSLVLDIKVGSGAFMKTIEKARILGHLMLDIGANMKIKTSAVLSSANQPLGKAVGNALEVKEAVETLQGNGPADLEEVCLEIASQMLLAGKICADKETALKKVTHSLKSGKALEKFKDIIKAQGGNPEIAENTGLLPSAEFSNKVFAPASGFIQSIDTEKIGLAAVYLGAGRSRQGETIDYSAGIIIHKKIGDYISANEPLASVFYNNVAASRQASKAIKNAFRIGDIQPDSLPLIYEIIN